MNGKEKSHFEDDENFNFKLPCLNPSHNPPMHLHIPSGQKYIHVCPGCGMKVVIRNNILIN